jgi:hypothetical protein
LGIFTAYVNGLVIEGNSLSGSVNEHGLYISNAARTKSSGRISPSTQRKRLQLNGDFAFGGGGTISNALVEGNIVFGNGVGGGGRLNNEGVQNSVFRNNLLYNNLAAVLSFGLGKWCPCGEQLEQ